MARSIGVLATRHIWVGVVDETTLGEVRMYPEPGTHRFDLKAIPADDILARIRERIVELARDGAIESVGAGFPGLIRNGMVEESPNLGQLKGLPICNQLEAALRAEGIKVP